MAINYNFILFTQAGVEQIIETLTNHRIANGLLRLFSYKENNLIDPSYIIEGHQGLYDTEKSFYESLDLMTKEIDQLLLISPPLMHDVLKKQLSDKPLELKRKFSKQLIRDAIQRVSNDKSPVDPNDLVSLITSNNLLDQYHNYISRFIREFEVAIEQRFNQNLATPAHSKGSDSNRSPERKPMLADPELTDLVKDKALFKQVCDHYSGPIVFNRKTYFLINKKDDKYYWQGTSRKGLSSLAALLAYMMEKDIIVFHGNYTGSARTFIDFFNMDLTTYSAEYLRKQVRAAPEKWQMMIKETFPH